MQEKNLRPHSKKGVMGAKHQTRVVRVASLWRFLICERRLESRAVVSVAEYLFEHQSRLI